MPCVIDAFDKNTWNDAETAYFEFVDEVIKDGRDDRFSNGKPWHAAYLIFKFLECARYYVRIFSGTLVCTTREGVSIYAAPSIIGAACNFLKRPGASLHITLQKEIDACGGDPKNHPLVAKVLALKEEGMLRGVFEVRRMNEATVNLLEERRVLHHMMLMDERGWRLETDPDPEGVKAMVNAGNVRETKSLCHAFDNGIWPDGETIIKVEA